ncbi:MAG TPA: hypothetical protein VM290_08665 [Gaiellaceae bacterium]|nr:hypothetical protein [Gaiellaceae bacterium]
MSRRIAATICAAVLVSAAVPQVLAAGPPAQLPVLTRVAAALSGLKPRAPVRVDVVAPAAIERQALRVLDRDYPRDRQAYDERLYRALGLLGTGEPLRPVLVAEHVRGVRSLYDPVARRAWVRRGGTQREAAIHALVLALQDQTFETRRASGLRRGSRDAALAAAAAVDGAAAFAGLQRRRTAGVRSPAAHEDSRIGLFVELQAGFTGSTGARFASLLHEVGTRTAVHAALRRFPETTEQIFHLGKFLRREQAKPVLLPAAAAGLELQDDDTFGELDVRALLAVHQVPRLDHAAEGWGGGRSAHYRDAAGRDAFALVLDWDGDADAAEWAEAVATWVNEAFHADAPGPPPATPCAVEFCWAVDGRSVAFARRGTETALVLGPSLVAAERLAQALVRRD